MVLPGPPRELQPIWSKAIQTAPVQDAIAGRTTYRQETIRIFGLPESSLADTLRDAEAAIPGFDLVEITTCLRRGEIEMVTRFEPNAAQVYTQLARLLRDRHGHQVYSEDGASVDELVAKLLTGRRIATAESCTAGLLAARLTDRPGSSKYVAGAVVAYSNEAKAQLLGVDPALIEPTGRFPSRSPRQWQRGRCKASAPTPPPRSPELRVRVGNAGKACGNSVLHRPAGRWPNNHPNRAAAREPVRH